jgi:hypothetical protein
MEKSIGYGRKQRTRNPTKMAMNRFWMPTDVGRPKREKQIR